MSSVRNLLSRNPKIEKLSLSNMYLYREALWARTFLQHCTHIKCLLKFIHTMRFLPNRQKKSTKPKKSAKNHSFWFVARTNIFTIPWPSERRFLIGLRYILKPIDLKRYKSYNHVILSVCFREICQVFLSPLIHIWKHAVLFYRLW